MREVGKFRNMLILSNSCFLVLFRVSATQRGFFSSSKFTLSCKAARSPELLATCNFPRASFIVATIPGPGFIWNILIHFGPMEWNIWTVTISQSFHTQFPWWTCSMPSAFFTSSVTMLCSAASATLLCKSSNFLKASFSIEICEATSYCAENKTLRMRKANLHSQGAYSAMQLIPLWPPNPVSGALLLPGKEPQIPHEPTL